MTVSLGKLKLRNLHMKKGDGQKGKMMQSFFLSFKNEIILNLR